jgi:hypothetical protein
LPENILLGDAQKAAPPLPRQDSVVVGLLRLRLVSRAEFKAFYTANCFLDTDWARSFKDWILLPCDVAKGGRCHSNGTTCLIF